VAWRLGVKKTGTEPVFRKKKKLHIREKKTEQTKRRSIRVVQTFLSFEPPPARPLQI
jgi:hypothetical protein